MTAKAPFRSANANLDGIKDYGAYGSYNNLLSLLWNPGYPFSLPIVQLIMDLLCDIGPAAPNFLGGTEKA